MGDCIPSIHESDAIFRGKVTQISHLKNNGMDENGKRVQNVYARFDVLETYKGKPGKVVDIYFYSMSPHADTYNAVGDIAWVYAKWNAERKRFDQGFCSLNRHPDDLSK